MYVCMYVCMCGYVCVYVCVRVSSASPAVAADVTPSQSSNIPSLTQHISYHLQVLVIMHSQMQIEVC